LWSKTEGNGCLVQRLLTNYWRNFESLMGRLDISAWTGRKGLIKAPRTGYWKSNHIADNTIGVSVLATELDWAGQRSAPNTKVQKACPQ